MVDIAIEEQIRALAAMRIRSFEDWTGSPGDGDHFGELPWLEIVTAASLALLAVDSHLKAADGVIDRLARLYKWLVKKQAPERPSVVTLAERIIVMLADERARNGSGLSVEQLAARTLTPVEAIRPELDRLCALSVAIESRPLWMLRTPSD